MVLHNSKWDKKATRNYNKKHGITNSSSGKTAGSGPHKGRYTGPARPEQISSNSENEVENGDRSVHSGDEEDDDDDEQELDPDNLSSLIPDAEGPPPTSSRRGKRNIKNLPSNNWRYQDPTSDEELDTMLKSGTQEDEEKALAELSRKAAQRQIEQQQLDLARSVKLDPKAINLESFSAPSGALKKKHKKKGKTGGYDSDEQYDPSDLLEDEEEVEEFMKNLGMSTPASVKPKKGQVQAFEDKTEFYELQQKIEKGKAAQEIKRKFGSNKTKRNTQNKMAGGKGKPGQEEDEEDIDDFLSSIDQLQVSSNGGATNKSSTLALSSNRKEGPSLFSSSTTVPLQKPGSSMQNTEAWLDNLLN